MRHQYKSIITSLLFLFWGCGDSVVASRTQTDPGNDNGNNNGNGNGNGQLVAQIVRPNGNVAILSGDSITLEADFTEGGATVAPASVSWDSDVFLGSTNPLRLDTPTDLATGTHTITVTGTLNGVTAKDTVTVIVGDFAVRITSPDSGDVEDQNSTIAFTGTAEVVETAGTTALVSTANTPNERDASFSWASSIDGAMGTGDALSYSTLSIGEHIITLTVSDDLTAGTNKSGTASVTLTVAPPNTRPTVQITTANCPLTIEQGTTQALDGTVTDPDAADAQIVGTWTDTLSGATGTGNSFSMTGSAAIGKHQVVFSATDMRGASDEDVCDVFVIPAGGAITDVFPNVDPINNNLAGGNDNIRWIGNDGNGNTLIGSSDGLTIVDSSGNVSDTYDGLDLGVSADTAKIVGFALAGDFAFIATDEGVAACTYTAGQLSNCTEVADGDFQSVAASGDAATSALIATAADGGGLYLASYVSGTLDTDATFKASNSNIPADDVQTLELVGDTLYVGTDGGFCIIDDANTALAQTGTGELCSTVLTEGNSILPSNDVNALAWDGDTLWIGTSNGLVAYDPTTESMRIFDKDTGMADDDVNDILVDGNGIVWVATDGGVSRIDLSSGNTTNFDGNDFGTPGDNRVRSIFIDADGTKWFGTDNGVIQYTGA